MISLKQRIKALPIGTVTEMRAHVIEEAKITSVTYNRFLSGKSQNLRVAQSMSNFLGITINQLLDHTFDLGSISKKQLIISKKQHSTQAV